MFEAITRTITRRRALGALAATPVLLRGAQTGTALGNEGQSPGFSGAVGWLNSAAVTASALHRKVVLVNFWTYSCINSLRELPHMKAWDAKYRDAGLVVVGVHTPEFAFEKETAKVQWAIKEYKVTYPIAIDTDYGVWRAFSNNYWPANYLVDGKGRIRFHYFGEGAYVESEHAIQQLLRENGAAGIDASLAAISAAGIEMPPGGDVRSPETYVGYARSERFASPGHVDRDSRKTYSIPVAPALNQWGLGGSWTVEPGRAVLQSAPGKIVFRFHSRDMHMVLGPHKGAAPVRFQVRLNGAPPGDARGLDCNSEGGGEIRESRLYQLIRQKGRVEDRTFEIEFLDPGVEAFSFTFG